MLFRSGRRHQNPLTNKVQAGGQPDDFRPIPSDGPGVMEIRIQEDNWAFRVFYVANRGDAVFVLHCFQKTAKKDICCREGCQGYLQR